MVYLVARAMEIHAVSHMPSCHICKIILGKHTVMPCIRIYRSVTDNAVLAKDPPALIHQWSHAGIAKSADAVLRLARLARPVDAALQLTPAHRHRSHSLDKAARQRERSHSRQPV